MFKQDTRNAIFDAVILNNGGTFNFAGEPVSFPDGYAVSLDGFESKTPLEGMSASNFVNLANDIVKRVDGLADPTTHFIGAWVEEGNLHVDLSVRIADREKAVSKAKSGNQLAIFDFATSESVRVAEIELATA